MAGHCRALGCNFEPMTREEKRAYMVRWRAEHREGLLAKSRAYYQAIRKHRPRQRRNDSDARCALCSILLNSRFGGRGRKKYCDSCTANYGRRIYNLWHRRAYQKRVGKRPEPLPGPRVVLTRPRTGRCA